MHCGAEVTESSTNKQHHLTPGWLVQVPTTSPSGDYLTLNLIFNEDQQYQAFRGRLKISSECDYNQCQSRFSWFNSASGP